MAAKNLSQALPWVLRHHARDRGIAINDEGFCRIEDLLACSTLQEVQATRWAILEVTRTCPKRRLEISRDGLLIRATSGHTMIGLEGCAGAEEPRRH